MGVKAIPTVLGNKKIPMRATTPKIAKAPPIPELNRDPSEVSIVQAAPKYENKSPKPAMMPIIKFPTLDHFSY
jgi:hypothetical protein